MTTTVYHGGSPPSGNDLLVSALDLDRDFVSCSLDSNKTSAA